MAILGIVAEYDPFHNGHLYHLREAKRLVQPDAVYVALSPCFKQRGDCSLLSPHDRAACAVSAGADAVFALPVLWAVRDAEHYALGAVSLLAGLGATHLAFGVETPDPAALHQVADLLENPLPGFRETLKARLAGGLGYPAALAAAAGRVLPGAGAILSSPNNTLAVCYLRAIRRLNLSLVPVMVPRRGEYHASSVDPEYPSASAVRGALSRGDYAAAFRAVPPETETRLRARFLAGETPDPAVLDAILLHTLRGMDPAAFRALPDAAEGLGDALAKACVSARSSRELIEKLTSRRYSAARVSRLCAHALLGVTRQQLLGLPLPSAALLLALRKNAAMTASWRNAAVRICPDPAAWRAEASAADLASWRIRAQCCGLPATLPFTEKTVTQ